MKFVCLLACLSVCVFACLLACLFVCVFGRLVGGLVGWLFGCRIDAFKVDFFKKIPYRVRGSIVFERFHFFQVLMNLMSRGEVLGVILESVGSPGDTLSHLLGSWGEV